MSSVLLGITLLAVAWLVIWAVKDHTKPSQSWWPFAMRDEAAPPPAQGRDRNRRHAFRETRTQEGNAQPPWRRSGS
jgi:hypothetical protein